MSGNVTSGRTVIDHLESDPKPLISFEIIPPSRGGNLESLEKTVSELASYNPPFIDVTSHQSELVYTQTPEGIRRTIRRKRPGTLGICAIVQHKYKIDAVPHILCNGFTREETEDFLIELSYAGIRNVLALRGDIPNHQRIASSDKTTNVYASDLVTQISEMNNGNYVDGTIVNGKPTNFCVGVAGYPEKHFQAPNMEFDVLNLKRKIEAGAKYVVTQMFFDNEKYYQFVDKCRAEGIKVPIIPGIKVLTSKRQLTTLPERFYASIPQKLVEGVQKADSDGVPRVGIDWAKSQIEDLFSNGVPSVHIYVMGGDNTISELMREVRK